VTERLATTCCIAGGGPAGMMLGLLLARAGVEVIVLEKHADFLRDFRGDTIHPSTLEVMHELGLLDALLALPHQKVPVLNGQVGNVALPVADFRHLPVRCGFIAMMPQWDFLNFLAEQGARHPGFRLRQQAEATGLIEQQGRIVGLKATTPEGALEVKADLVVGADGRHSAVRAAAGLKVRELGAPMDVLWFRLTRRPADPAETMGRFDAGRICVLINRAEHWQCGYVIPKGAAGEVRAAGVPAFRATLARLLPWAAARVEEIADWKQVKLLTVQIDRLKRWWRPGLLCIGDAAHAMSPVGGVGINVAIQDAVAAANVLSGPLLEARLSVHDLKKLQRRRKWPVRVTQRLQILAQDRIISRVLRSTRPLKPPLFFRLLTRSARLRRIPGRLIGMGVRPEHIAPGR